MRIAICDDHQFFTQELENQIQSEYNSLDLLIHTFSCGEDLVSYYHKGNVAFDVILLDMEMKELDGLKTAKIIRQIAPKTFIIFITIHSEMASIGYEVSAFRFLSKPVKAAKLFEALEAAKAQIRETKIIYIKNSEGEYAIDMNDIIYFEAQIQQVKIQTRYQTFFHRYNISDYVKELENYDFISVHRSYLINLKYTKGIVNQEIIMEGDILIPISRLKYQKVKHQFHYYISKTSI